MKSSPVREIIDILEREEKTIILHSNADLDSAGCAAALKLFFGRATLCAPGGVSHLGKRLLDELGLDFLEHLDAGDEAVPVVVDAHDDASLGFKGVDWASSIVIDHHLQTGESVSRCSYMDDTSTSACELAWELMGRPEKVDEKIGIALLAGILADTGHLRRGDHRTLTNASEILRASDLCMDDLAPTFETADSQDMSRRISRMKGAQRLKFERTGDWLIAKSEVGAFEGAVCHALLNIGADIALVGSQKDDDFRITGRATKRSVEAGIHLGELMNRISEEAGGQGGGHDGAAGLSGHGDVEAMLGICAHNCLTILKGKGR